MKLLCVFSALLLIDTTAAAPASSEEDDKIIVTEEFYPDSLVKYQSKHDIVSIMVPLNAINTDETETSSSEEDADVTFFFVEADVDADGRRTYQGLYIFKDGKATKILDNGRAAAASSDDGKQVFFAAQDGVYEYNWNTNETVKYGSITDSIIGIAKTNVSDVIYILTEDHELYKVTDAGNTKTKINEVVNAQEIILDYSDNLYFYAEDNKPYVLTSTGLKNIEGLPSNPTKVNLIKPPFIFEAGVPFIVDNVVYIIYANGTSEQIDFEFKPEAKPTAYAMEGTLIQYYAYNKKIYEYNILALLLADIIEELNKLLSENASTIRSLASQKMGNKSKI